MKKRVICICALIVFICHAPPLFAQTREYKLAIREKGKVAFQKQQTEDWTSIIASVLLHDGDILKTREGSLAALRLFDGSTVKIGENSLVEVSQYGSAKPNFIQLVTGKILVHVRQAISREREFRVRTHTATLAARGTVFSVDVVNADGATIVQAIHGQVEIHSYGVRTILGQGKTAVVNPDSPPVIVPPGFHVILVAVPVPSGDKGITRGTPQVSPGTPTGTTNQTLYESPWKPADFAPMVSQDAPPLTAAPAISSTATAISLTETTLSPTTTSSSSTTSSTPTASAPTSATTTTTTTTTTLPPAVTPPLVPTGGIQVIVK